MDASRAIAQLVNDSGKLFCVDFSIVPEKVFVFNDYIKEGYGVLNNEVNNAVKIMAKSEGILLDPIYTGKAMAMLIDFIQNGNFKKDNNVVFIHTGGLPALFLYRNEFRSPKKNHI